MKDKKETIELTVDKPCKHSIRFSTDAANAAISTVYVNRGPAIDAARKIRVTIEVVE